MSLFQSPPRTREELEAARPVDVPPTEVMELDEAGWYARVFRGEKAPQLTVRAVVMGTILGFFLSFTNLYLGLKVGWHLGVAITACILSFAAWNGLLRLGLAKTPMTILENNCMASTASSAGYATGSTMVSAVPALLLLSVTADNPGGTQLPWPVLVGWTFFLAALGVVLAIPMKRNMINQERLKFPSGTAAAVTLQSLYSQGAEAMARARALLVGAALGAAVPLLKDLRIKKVVTVDTAGVSHTAKEGLLPGESPIFDWLGRLPIHHASGDKLARLSEFNLALDHGVALLGAGVLIGVRVTASMVVGAIAVNVFVGPKALAWTWTNPAGKVIAAARGPATVWKDIGVWIGAPMLVASGLLLFALQWRTIARAFKGFAGGGREVTEETRRTEVPLKWFLWGALAAGASIIALTWWQFQVPPHLGALAVLLTFFLALVACRATGETDITPTGAMGKIMQLTYGVLIPQSTTANLMTAGITAGTSAASADLLNDLKSGYLLGAHPRRQFIAQFLGIFSGTAATVLGFHLLVPNATALTGDGTKAPMFPAPAAQQWKTVAEVFKVGLSNMHPMAVQGVAWGIGIGLVLGVVEFLTPKAKKFLPSATGLGLGMILPASSSISMCLGAAIAALITSIDKKVAERYVVPVASGLIAGESILGVLVAALNNFVL